MTDENFGPLNIGQHAEDLDLATPNELSPNRKALFRLGGWVLFVSALLMLVAWTIQFVVGMWGLPDASVCSATTDGDAAKAEQLANACNYAQAVLESRTAAASDIFEFAKSWIPPIVTLVLGYFFAREQSENDISGNSDG